MSPHDTPAFDDLERPRARRGNRPPGRSGPHPGRRSRRGGRARRGDVRAGILEPSDKNQVRDAIVTDTAITERQKQILLDIYLSFTQQNESIQEECSTESDSE